MLTLVGRSFSLLLQRWPLYLGCAVIATVLQGAVALTLHVPTVGELVGEAVVQPILFTALYAFMDADLRDADDEYRKNLWSRILERAWAVMVIQLIDFLLYTAAFSAAGTGADLGSAIVAMFLATILCVLVTAMVFADVIATVSDEGNPLWLIQHSIGRSVWNVFQGRENLMRALVLVALNFAVSALCESLGQLLLKRHAVPNEFWVDIPLETLLSLPLAAMTIVFYRASIEASNAAHHKD